MALTLERLKEVLDYDPKTGLFKWKVKNARADIGAIAGATDHYGYICIRIDKILYKAHRLAWFYVYEAWPDKNIDHINRVKNDNRISNLRSVGQSTNMHNVAARVNSKSGVSGVVWRKERRKWCARIKVGYKSIYLGSFEHKDDAIAARINAEKRLLDCYKNF